MDKQEKTNKLNYKRVKLIIDRIKDDSINENIKSLKQNQLNIIENRKNKKWDAFYKEQSNAVNVIKNLKSSIDELNKVKSLVDDENLTTVEKEIEQLSKLITSVIENFYVENECILKSMREDEAKRRIYKENFDTEFTNVDKLTNNQTFDSLANENARLDNENKKAQELLEKFLLLQNDLTQLLLISEDLNQIVKEHAPVIDQIEDNIVNSEIHINEGVAEIKKASILKNKVVPLATATLAGAAAGGPVGAVVGLHAGIAVFTCSFVAGLVGGFVYNKKMKAKAIEDEEKEKKIQ